MTCPSSPRVVDILADLAIQDAVDDYLQGADQVAAHQLWMRERLEYSQRLNTDDWIQKTKLELDLGRCAHDIVDEWSFCVICGQLQRQAFNLPPSRQD